MIKKIIKTLFKNDHHFKLFKNISIGSTVLFFCGTMLSIEKEQSQNYLHYPKKIVTHVIMQKTLANATNVIKSIHNRYGLNYNTFQALGYIKLFKHPSLINCLYNIESTNSLEPVFFL